MFKEFFLHQPDSLFIWPIVALVAFAAVFITQVVVIALRDVDKQAALPLEENEVHRGS